MAGPQDWGAEPVEADQASGPTAWGAVPAEAEAPPQPFLDRLAYGRALDRVLAPFIAASKGAAAGFGPEPLGFSGDHVRQLQEAGIYRDPVTGRGGPVRLFNELVMQPASVLGDVLVRGINAGVHGIAGAVGQIVEDAGGALGSPEAARNEVVNFANYLMLRGDHEFSRFEHGPAGPADQRIGTLPTDQDFKTSAELLGTPVAEANLRQLWEERGIHPAEAVADARNDAFLRHDLTTPEEQARGDSAESAGESLRAVGAEVTRDMPTLAEQPPPRPGRLIEVGRQAMDQALGLARNVQFMLDPMSTGSNRAMVIAKDAMNAVRRIWWEHLRVDQEITRNFDFEQQGRMWNAADEESVLRQEGQASEHMGLATLEPNERAAVEAMHARAEAAWLHARDTGMVEGEGLPAYTPRMVMNVAAASDDLSPRALNELGRNVFTRTSQMLHRSHLTAEETEAAAKELVGKRMAERGASLDEINAAMEKVQIARNIRALPLATARLEEAAVWKDMVNKIEDVGKAAGDATVAVGFKPGPDWFTIAGNPVFTKWEPALEKNPVTGKWSARTDDAGNVLFVPKPIYMSAEFKGPLTSILDEAASKNKLVQGAQSLYGAMMAVKGKAMTVILNSSAHP